MDLNFHRVFKFHPNPIHIFSQNIMQPPFPLEFCNFSSLFVYDYDFFQRTISPYKIIHWNFDFQTQFIWFWILCQMLLYPIFLLIHTQFIVINHLIIFSIFLLGFILGNIPTINSLILFEIIMNRLYYL